MCIYILLKFNKLCFFTASLNEKTEATHSITISLHLREFHVKNMVLGVFLLTDMEDASAFLHDNSDIISSTSTPMVGLLIQGGPIDIEHVVDLLRKKVPVLVVKGSGLAADLVAFVFNEKLTQ